ncbi:MAG: TIGR02117 family protein [Planctomycetales bacterium]|nr:TIGR02117 family protein [Planctomycetales bacterium]
MKALAPSQMVSTTKLKRCLRWIHRTGKWALFALVGVVLVYLVGLIPVNLDFVPAQQGVPIHVLSNSVHADIVVPIVTDDLDWRTVLPMDQFPDDIRDATHVAFGWGDKGFYLETPTWSDLKFSTAANALLLPSDCCLHVQFMQINAPPTGSCSVTITSEQYGRLAANIQASFVRSRNESFVPIAGVTYNNWDRFFDANGNYHLFYTCNSWVGECLREAGIRTAILTPLPGTPTLYFPD